MQVEILEERLSSDGFQGSRGDRFTVPDEVGSAWCGHGWAKDVDGKVDTGDRNINPVIVNPKNLAHKSNLGGV